MRYRKLLRWFIAAWGIALFVYGVAWDAYRHVFWQGGAASLTLPEKLMFFGFGLMLIALLIERKR